MTNDQAVALLRETRDRLWQALENTQLEIDARLAFTIGIVQGAISEGLDAYFEDRQIRGRLVIGNDA